ncbi:molybdenum cofactor biosynthesis protein MoaB [Pendulispora brunnea]|uniref:Molybdenum cofactor biosynthesis protein B n=1 Tax=Pendulispora brunnea TaxID=2905690 RepID=A0ABZ2KJB3_9BACT
MASDTRKLSIATVTVSDTRTKDTDESGTILAERLLAAGFSVVEHHIVPDDPDQVSALVRRLAASDIEAVVLTGGTGIAPRDNTYEVLDGMFDKRLDGFGEAFRRLSWDTIGPRAILSRATAGIIGKVVVFSLPGSPNAVRLAVDSIIAKTLEHAVALVSGKKVKHHHHHREGQ